MGILFLFIRLDHKALEYILGPIKSGGQFATSVSIWSHMVKYSQLEAP